MRVRSVGYDHKNELLFVTFDLDEEGRKAGDYLHRAMLEHEEVSFQMPVKALVLDDGMVIEVLTQSGTRP